MLCAVFFAGHQSGRFLKAVKPKKSYRERKTAIIKDGVIQLRALAENRLSHQQVYAALRSENVYNLGKIKRLYLEAYGVFSIYQDEPGKPGLSVLPPTDSDIQSIHEHPDDKLVACSNCGNTVPAQPQPGACSVCGAAQWAAAIR